MPANIIPDWSSGNWSAPRDNPIIGHIEGSNARCAIGDPQIILPGEFDNQWHMFFHGNKGGTSETEVIYSHCVSDNGLDWIYHKIWNWPCGPSYITCDGERWILFYTDILLGHETQQVSVGSSTVIRAKTTSDFVTWSQPIDILEPELDWECEGKAVQARNPCVILLPDGGYRMYYSAGTIWLDDCGYEEPKYIGVAHADSILGPWRKADKPILGPEPENPYANFGAGALKVYRYGFEYLGLYNPLYKGEDGHSHSAICMLMSHDGLDWRRAQFNPIIEPEDGWTKALVYQLDLRQYEGKLWLYFNARNDWHDGVEHIGCLTMPWDGAPVEKMWSLSGKGISNE